MGFVTRLEEEAAQLSEKIEKLSLFLTTDTFDTLDAEMQWLMQKQFWIMQMYEEILLNRLDLLNA